MIAYFQSVYIALFYFFSLYFKQMFILSSIPLSRFCSSNHDCLTTKAYRFVPDINVLHVSVHVLVLLYTYVLHLQFYVVNPTRTHTSNMT